jgi:fumarate reductase subunit C
MAELAAESNSNANQAKLWYWQRISAMVLALCVLLHLGVIIYAVKSGLSAAHILARTHGSLGFALFYGVFVIACAIHAPIGLANIADETLQWGRGKSILLARVFALLILVMGLRAVYGVTFS